MSRTIIHRLLYGSHVHSLCLVENEVFELSSASTTHDHTSQPTTRAGHTRPIDYR